MRTTIVLDDDLLRTAQELTGIEEMRPLVREALKALIDRESARRLAALGGSMPRLKSVPATEVPQALKRGRITASNGTTEVVPFPKILPEHPA